MNITGSLRTYYHGPHSGSAQLKDVMCRFLNHHEGFTDMMCRFSPCMRDEVPRFMIAYPPTPCGAVLCAEIPVFRGSSWLLMCGK